MNGSTLNAVTETLLKLEDQTIKAGARTLRSTLKRDNKCADYGARAATWHFLQIVTTV